MSKTICLTDAKKRLWEIQIQYRLENASYRDESCHSGFSLLFLQVEPPNKKQVMFVLAAPEDAFPYPGRGFGTGDAEQAMRVVEDSLEARWSEIRREVASSDKKILTHAPVHVGHGYDRIYLKSTALYGVEEE